MAAKETPSFADADQAKVMTPKAITDHHKAANLSALEYVKERIMMGMGRKSERSLLIWMLDGVLLKGPSIDATYA